ncbi:MAG TPA: serine--tRNA ligase [Verrucomicrobia bacterium]|nr:serine--tRNA ligase [Verrucomicrobiota bacterium]
MLDIKRIRERPEEIRQGLRARGADASAVDAVLALDTQRRDLLTATETRKSDRNRISKTIGERRKQGEDTADMQAQVRDLGDEISAMDERVREVEAQLEARMLMIPNIPCPHIPVGPDASGNRVVRTWGEPRTFNFQPKSHIELGEKLGIFDFARATRMTGAGFPLLVGAGSRLQRGLIQYMLDLHITEHGYTEIWPPALCNTRSMTGTGQLPKMAEDMYHLVEDDLWMIPTAEVPVTNYYREEIIDRPLPISLTAYTPCFRREAGAAGKGTRGMIRVHQFDKVEMVKFVEPATSYDVLEALTGNAEDVLQRLGLCYRVLELCSGDISFAAAKCYDLELWAPGQDGWLEVSSCSNFEDFQARRAGIRYRDSEGKVQFVHTLNGSGVALPRLVVAIIENGQQEDGSVILPPAIVPYMGGMDRITA